MQLQTKQHRRGRISKTSKRKTQRGNGRSVQQDMHSSYNGRNDDCFKLKGIH
ncbi:MAG: hypothetical protein OEY10_01310 [Nitrosopumilus sp.]|nr:hypothetical protein [Nitrosopumilus sp.]